MRVTLNQPAAPGTVFAADAFAAVVGQAVPCRIGSLVYDGTVLDVRVVDRGAAARITVEISEQDATDDVLHALFRVSPVG